MNKNKLEIVSFIN